METKNSSKITTIKLSLETKARLDNLKVYRRETYEDLLKNMLEILNICRVNPEKARKRLIILDRAKYKEKSNFDKEKLNINNH